VVGGYVSHHHYRFIAAHLGVPFTRIADLPLQDVEYERLRNGAGSFRAKLQLPNVSEAYATSVARVETENDADPRGLEVPGAGNATTPRGPTLGVAGDQDVRAYCALDDWTSGANQTLASRWNDVAADSSWLLRVTGAGNLVFVWSTGTTTLTKMSTVALTSVDGIGDHLRATLDVDNGAAGNDVRFYTSFDGVTWTPLGTVVTTAGVTTVNLGNQPLRVGAREGSVDPAVGRFFGVEERASIEGEVVAGPDFRVQAAGEDLFVDLQGNEWTVTAPAAIEGVAPVVSYEPQPLARDNTAAVRRAELYKTATDRATTCVYVVRDGVPMGAYAIWEQDYSSVTQTITLGGAELTSYLRRRVVEDAADLDARVDYSGVAMYDAVADLVGRVNDIGLTLDYPVGEGAPLPGPTPQTSTSGATDGTGWKGTDAKWTGDAVQELANQEDGFDYRVDLVPVGGEFQRVLRIAPVLGGEVTAVAKFTANVPDLGVARRGDVRANDYLVVGASENDKRPSGRASSGAWTPPLQTVLQLNDETDQDRLDAAAASGLNAVVQHEVIMFDVTATKVDTQLTALFPGDLVRIVVPADLDPWYPLGMTDTVRTLGYMVRVPETGGPENIHLLVDDDLEVLQGA